MNILYTLLVLFSGVSFVVYGVLLFTSTKMQNEFKRFGLERFTKVTGLLELLGGIGLFLGLKYNFILLISSGPPFFSHRLIQTRHRLPLCVKGLSFYTFAWNRVLIPMN